MVAARGLNWPQRSFGVSLFRLSSLIPTLFSPEIQVPLQHSVSAAAKLGRRPCLPHDEHGLPHRETVLPDQVGRHHRRRAIHAAAAVHQNSWPGATICFRTIGRGIWSENLDNLIFLCLSVLPSYCSTNFAKISSALLMLVVLSFHLLPVLELESKSTLFQIWIRIQLWN